MLILLPLSLSALFTTRHITTGTMKSHKLWVEKGSWKCTFSVNCDFELKAYLWRASILSAVIPLSSSSSRSELSDGGTGGLTEGVWVNQPISRPRTKSATAARKYLWWMMVRSEISQKDYAMSVPFLKKMFYLFIILFYYPFIVFFNSISWYSYTDCYYLLTC